MVKDKVRRAAEWLGDLADKVKAIAAAVGAFAAVVATASGRDALGLDDVTSVLTAAATLAFAVYYIVWRVPNEGHLNLGQLSDQHREAIHRVLTKED